VNDDMKIIWKEAVTFVVPTRHSGATEENYENLTQDRDLNPEPPEYEAGVLILDWQ
jgi:hypothetical protein